MKSPSIHSFSSGIITRRLILLAAAAILIGLSAASVNLCIRAAAERHMRSVEICIDFREVEKLAEKVGISADDLLLSFRESGAGTIAVDVAEGTGPAVYQERLKPLKGMGYRILLRIDAYAEDAGDMIGRLAQAVGDEYISSVILRGFGGPDSLEGDASGVDDLINRMRELSIPLGIMEFTDGSGPDYGKVAEKIGYDIVRVHTIPDTEYKEISRDESIRRYIRGARERGICILLLNLHPEEDMDRLGPNTISEDLRFVRDLRIRLERNGLAVGKASRLPQLHGSKAIGAILIVMTVLISYITARILLPRKFEGMIGAIALLSVLILLVFLVAVGGHEIYKVTAIAASLAFPLFSGFSLLAFGTAASGKRGLSGGRVLIASSVYWALATLVSVAGGLFVAGLLFDSEYLLYIDRFSGVKAMYVTPIAIYGAGYPYYIKLLGADSGDFSADMKGRFGNRSLIMRLFAFALLAAAFVVYIGRSGNEFPIPLPQFDRNIRFFLEDILPVRPRLKEFMIGHPSMITAAILIIKKRYREAWPFFILGMVGQISVVNTFAHIHSPMAISLVRTFLGALPAVPLGIGLYSIYDKLLDSAVVKGKGEEGSWR